VPSLLALLALLAAPEPWRSTPLPPPLPVATAEGATLRDGARLEWSSYGEGPTVVMLHGGAGNASHWALQLPALLAAGRRVLLVDSRGHGKSTHDGSPLSYHRMAEDVVDVLDALQLDRVDVVGWSDGGIIGLDLALHHPERLRRLAISGANFDLSGMKPGGGKAATFDAYFARCAADYQRLAPVPEAYPALLAVLRPMWRTQPTYAPAALRKVPLPVLVMDGEHDEIIEAAHLRRLAGLLPKGRLLLIPGASHFVLWQAPEAFNRALLDFLAEGSPTPAAPSGG
jgi:pimeloyl-ACP methyl ester carboxylesterase